MDLQIPKQNFGEYVIGRMHLFGSLVALVDAQTRKTYTYSELASRIRRLASGLSRFGLKQGDVLCILTTNNLEYPCIFYATTLIGTILQPLNPLLLQDDLLKSFRTCGTKYVLTSSTFVEKLTDVVASNSLDIKIILLDESSGHTTLESLLDQEEEKFESCSLDPQTSVAALFATSGTTGAPKAVKLSHYGLAANVCQIFHADPFPPGETYLVFLPMFHVYGLNVVTTLGLCYGARLVIMSRYNPDTFLDCVQWYKVTTLHLVPPILVMLAKNPSVSDYDLSSVKRVYCGAAPLGKETAEQVLKVLNQKIILQGFAMTEVGVTHLNTEKSYKIGSAGKPLSGVRTKIISLETKAPLGINEDGEILIQGPQVGLGYFGNEESTSETFLDDGWIRTGDIGHVDEDGYLFIVDRLKELIKYKGYQVAPAKLEDLLLKHVAVKDACVVGILDEEAGELPSAFVVKKPGYDVTSQQLVDFVAENVAPHMKIRGGAQFVSEIPRSASGKILRRQFKEKVNKENNA